MLCVFTFRGQVGEVLGLASPAFTIAHVETH